MDQSRYNSRLFLDDTHIRESCGLTRVWHQLEKVPDPIMVAEHPWEHWSPVLYGTVLEVESRFMMWYCTWTRKSKPRCCYAESDDGVEWRKPGLGLCEFDGSRDNNIVLESEHGENGIIDDVSVIHDPEDTDYPLKMLLWDGSYRDGHVGISAARSVDGIHWERLGMVLPGWGDRFNAMPYRVDGRFVVLGRAPGSVESKGRVVCRTESEDLQYWSEPELVLQCDLEDPPNMQTYSLCAAEYEGVAIGGMERMHMSPDRLDTELVFSRDQGLSWQRSRTRPAFLRTGEPQDWDRTWANLASNVYIRYGQRLRFYYSGRSAAHMAVEPLNRGGVGLGLLRIDGFASIRAEEKEGWLMTQPVTWPEAELGVNVDCRRDLRAHPGHCCGRVEAAVLDEAGEPVEGYGREDCIPIEGNTERLPDAMATAHWKDQRSMKALAGRTLCLAFYMRDAHLYSFKALA